MKDTRRCVCLFSYYDQQSIVETLERMAENGWMLEKPGSFLWTYRRAEPKKLRFCVTCFSKASDFDPGPADGEQTRIDYCREDGWELAARWGVMQMRRAARSGARRPATRKPSFSRAANTVSMPCPPAEVTAWPEVTE